MSRQDTKESRIETLIKTQAARKQDSLERVYKAIERLQKMDAKINFHTVAKEASVSVSYLYKYPEIKQKIGELRNQQSSIFINSKTNPIYSNSKSHSQILERLKKRIHQLEEEKQELRHKNEALAGQVYRVHYLQEQVERQQKTIEDLQIRLKVALAQTSTAKVIPISEAKSQTVSEEIQQELSTSGVRMTPSLSQVIRSHNEEIVLLAIKAFKQYREAHSIKSPTGCLRRAIEENWVPNQALTPSTPEQEEFDQFYENAVAKGFLVDIPKNHLAIQGGSLVVKINRPCAFAPWTPMLWREAKTEFEAQNSDELDEL
jgi:hypothetical protein